MFKNINYQEASLDDVAYKYSEVRDTLFEALEDFDEDKALEVLQRMKDGGWTLVVSNAGGKFTISFKLNGYLQPKSVWNADIKRYYKD